MTEPYRILLIEDEAGIASFIRLELKHEGYEVSVARDGRVGLDMALSYHWDLILLDIMLPNMSGMEICRRIRVVNRVPIIMLTARGEIPDRVAGLDAGADDYISKPFALEELLARIRALLRRQNPEAQEELKLMDLVLNSLTREVTRAGQVISLTAREFDVLELLLRNQTHVLSRDSIVSKIWGFDYTGDSNIVDVHIRNIRQKIDVPFEQPLLHTIRGVGYVVKGVT